MAILHLQLEIDSDVQPELYAVLSTIGLSLPRSERLRQLAAAGLIWEHLRLQALAGLAGAPSLPDLRPAPMAAPQFVAHGELPNRRDVQETPQPASEPELEPVPAPHASASTQARVDLSEAGDTGSSGEPKNVQAHPPTWPGEDFELLLPVLDDVVEEVDEPPRAASAPPPAPAARAAAAKEPAARRGGSEPAKPPAATITAAPRKSASRTRLAKMQEKGLFKNG